MPVSKDFITYTVEQLSGLGAVTPKRMFGGVGLYARERFFALIDNDVLYLKVDDSNRADFVARGAEPFRPFPDKPYYSMSYYAVPADVFEDAEELAIWARRAVLIASPPKAPRTKARVARPKQRLTKKRRE